MDGIAHAASGMAAGAAIGYGLSLSIPATVIGAIVCGGAALLPDADHPKATIARSAGVVTYMATSLINGVTGGHRHWMHWLGTAAIFSLVAALPAFDHATPVRAVTWGILTILCASALKVTRLHRKRGEAFLSGLVIAALALYAVPQWLWLFVLIGMTLHCVEDLATGNRRHMYAQMVWPLAGPIPGRGAASKAPVRPRSGPSSGSARPRGQRGSSPARRPRPRPSARP